MLAKQDQLDRMMKTAEGILQEMFPNGVDPGSPIPVEYQNIRQYFLNEKGIHALNMNHLGELDVTTIYPIPFVVTMDEKANIRFHFFIEKKVVEVDSNLERFIEQYFHSASEKQRLDLKRFASVCIMRKLPLPKEESNNA